MVRILHAADLLVDLPIHRQKPILFTPHIQYTVFVISDTKSGAPPRSPQSLELRVAIHRCDYATVLVQLLQPRIGNVCFTEFPFIITVE